MNHGTITGHGIEMILAARGANIYHMGTDAQKAWQINKTGLGPMLSVVLPHSLRKRIAPRVGSTMMSRVFMKKFSNARSSSM